MSQDTKDQTFDPQSGQETPSFPYAPQSLAAYPPYPNPAPNSGYPSTIGFQLPFPQANTSRSYYPSPAFQNDAAHSQPTAFNSDTLSQPGPISAPPPNSSSTPAYIGRYGRPQKGLKWVKTSGRCIPEGAIQGGYESDNRPLYIGRGYHKGCLVVGKAAGHLNGCMIPYGGEEITLKDYHVLVGDAEKVKWRECYDKLEINGWVPLEAGNEADGVELFIAKTFYKNSEVVGKVSENMRHGMTFGYAGVEIHAKKPMVYHVLSLA